MRRMSRARHGRLGLGLALFLALALLTVGCGGGGSVTVGSTGQGKSQGSEAGTSSSGESSGGASSGKGLKKAEEFGSVATGSDAEQVEAALVGYLEAQANGEWSRACSYLAKGLRKFRARVRKSAQGTPGGCPGFTAQVTQRLSPSDRSNLPDVKVQSVRLKGANGYVIYIDGSGKKVSKPVRREAGEWRLSSLIVQLLEQARSSR